MLVSRRWSKVCHCTIGRQEVIVRRCAGVPPAVCCKELPVSCRSVVNWAASDTIWKRCSCSSWQRATPTSASPERLLPALPVSSDTERGKVALRVVCVDYIWRNLMMTSCGGGAMCGTMNMSPTQSAYSVTLLYGRRYRCCRRCLNIRALSSRPTTSHSTCQRLPISIISVKQTLQHSDLENILIRYDSTWSYICTIRSFELSKSE